jgi:hypothetical protein
VKTARFQRGTSMVQQMRALWPPSSACFQMARLPIVAGDIQPVHDGHGVR